MASNGIPSWSTTAASNVLANTGVNWDEGQPPSTVNDSARQILADLATWYANFGPSLLENYSFACSVSSNALTIALKRRDGSDPSTDQPVRIAFRNVTAATGDYSIVKVTASTSIVVSSGSTLGTTSAVASRLWVVAFNDGGTFRLGVINCLSGTSIYGLRDDNLESSTAEGGAGAADSAQVIYTGSAVSAKAMRVLGYVESTQATAGTWATAPSKAQLFGPGISLPGTEIQTKSVESGAVLSAGTTTIPLDDTVPTASEGDSLNSVLPNTAITPKSACNVLKISADVNFSVATSVVQQMLTLCQDSADAIAVASMQTAAAGANSNLQLKHRMLAATTSATTFKLRIGNSAGNATTINGRAGSRDFGGVYASSFTVKEVMA